MHKSLLVFCCSEFTRSAHVICTLCFLQFHGGLCLVIKSGFLKAGFMWKAAVVFVMKCEWRRRAAPSANLRSLQREANVFSLTDTHNERFPLIFLTTFKSETWKKKSKCLFLITVYRWEKASVRKGDNDKDCLCDAVGCLPLLARRNDACSDWWALDTGAAANSVKYRKSGGTEQVQRHQSGPAQVPGKWRQSSHLLFSPVMVVSLICPSGEGKVGGEACRGLLRLCDSRWGTNEKLED